MESVERRGEGERAWEGGGDEFECREEIGSEFCDVGQKFTE